MAVTTATLKASSASRVNKTGRSAITVIESVLAGTTTPVMSTFSGNVGATGQGMALMPTQNGTTGMTLPSVSALPFEDGVATKDQLLASAKTNIESQANDVATKLKAVMSTYGHKAGNFIFEQTIKPAGSLTYVKVVWHVAVLETGRVVYSGARITDPDPYYVYAVYTSKQVAAGLPLSWAYPDGGKLKWQLVKKDGTQLTAMTTIDVNGAFDAPVVPDGTTSDPDWGVKCMADHASISACLTTSGFTDIKTLISSTSASGAFIDYVRQLQPMYDSSTDASTGQPIQVARVAVSVDSRTMTPTDCTHVSYRNTGRYGFALNTTTDRFVVQGASNSPNLVNRYTSTTLSATQSYDYTTNTTLTSSQLQNQVINPFASTGPLIATNTIPNLTSLAPISVDDSALGQISVTGYGQGGGRGYTGESINVSTSWSGNTFVLNMSTPWIEGYDDGRVIRDTYIDLSIPLCRIESASIVSTGGVQGQVIFVNGSAASATDGLGMNVWDASAQTCDDSGCSSGGWTTVWNQPMVPFITQSFSWGTLLRNSNAYWHGSSYLPVSIMPKLVNGSNRLLFQHLTFHGSTSAATIYFNMKNY